MKIGFANDHRGYELKEKLKKDLEELNYEVVDYGSYSTNSVDYPDFAFSLGRAVVDKKVDFGVAICGSGIGISIACNKVKGIRCARVTNVKDVIATRNDNDANIVAFSGDLEESTALNIVKTFVTTPCSEEEKHKRRRNKIAEFEEKTLWVANSFSIS